MRQYVVEWKLPNVSFKSTTSGSSYRWVLRRAVQFLETVVERLMEAKLARSEQPLLFLRLHLAQYRLQLGEVAECAKAVEAGKEELDSLRDVRSCACPRSLKSDV